MAEKIKIKLNDAQMAKIKKKFPEQAKKGCDCIEVDPDDLINMVKYISPQICIDFDDDQEAVVQKFFPGKECDFAIIDATELAGCMRYLSPGSC